MKDVALLTTALLLGFAACSAPQESRIDPSLPYPDAKLGNVVREDDDRGVLMVATSLIRVSSEGLPYGLPHDLDWDSSHLVPSGYTLYDPGGRRIVEVPNHSPLVVGDEGPTDVPLPAGRYLVRLQRPAGDTRTFWVSIRARRRTEVDPARLGGVPEPELR
jgi:hypothetical protein